MISSTIGTLKVPKAAQAGILIAGVLTGAAITRLLRLRTTTVAEQLAASLLDTLLLERALESSATAPQTAMYLCTSYAAKLIADTAGQPIVGKGKKGADIPTTHHAVHPYSGAVADVSIVKDATTAKDNLIYLLDLQSIVSLRGMRTVDPMRTLNLMPVRPTRDQVQFDFANGYTVQIDSQLTVSDFVATGANKVQGSLTISDNKSFTANLFILADGTVSGPVRRGCSDVIGKFAGCITNIQYIPFREGAGDE